MITGQSLDHRFFERPILNSPHEYPAGHNEIHETLSLHGSTLDLSRPLGQGMASDASYGRIA